MLTTKLLAKKVTIPLGIILVLIIAGIYYGTQHPDVAINFKTDAWQFITTLPTNAFDWMHNLLGSIF